LERELRPGESAAHVKEHRILYIGFGLTLPPILEYSKFYVRIRKFGVYAFMPLVQYLTYILHNPSLQAGSRRYYRSLSFLPLSAAFPAITICGSVAAFVSGAGLESAA
jgi:hypothetical protein